jgi:hypothetical protein
MKWSSLLRSSNDSWSPFCIYARRLRILASWICTYRDKMMTGDILQWQRMILMEPISSSKVLAWQTRHVLERRWGPLIRSFDKGKEKPARMDAIVHPLSLTTIPSNTIVRSSRHIHPITQEPQLDQSTIVNDKMESGFHAARFGSQPACEYKSPFASEPRGHYALIRIPT